MTRVSIYALVVTLVLQAVALTTFAEEPIPITSVPLDLYQLKSWGTKHYFLSQYRKKFRSLPSGLAVIELELHPVGKLPLETHVDADRVTMRQYWRDPEAKLSRMWIEYQCAFDNILTMEKITTRYQDKIATADTTEGKYDIEVFGHRRIGKWPENTMTDAAMLRIVTLLPRIEGTAFTVPNWSRTPQLGVESTNGGPIRCVGKQTLKVRGKEFTCTKFECKRMHAWVTDDDVLVRAESPGWWILELDE